MSKRTFIALLVSIKLLAVGAMAAVGFDNSLKADHSDWMDDACAPWEIPCDTGEPGS